MMSSAAVMAMQLAPAGLSRTANVSVYCPQLTQWPVETEMLRCGLSCQSRGVYEYFFPQNVMHNLKCRAFLPHTVTDTELQHCTVRPSVMWGFFHQFQREQRRWRSPPGIQNRYESSGQVTAENSSAGETHASDGVKGDNMTRVNSLILMLMEKKSTVGRLAPQRSVWRQWAEQELNCLVFLSPPSIANARWTELRDMTNAE